MQRELPFRRRGKAAFWRMPTLAMSVLFALSFTDSSAQSIYTPYAFTNFAGLPGVGGQADGSRNTASFRFPRGVAADTAGNVYVADTINHTIRKIAVTGIVSTLAGVAGQSGTNDGVGNLARFNSPYGIAVDSTGNLYVGDYNSSTVRKITPDRDVTTLAGTGGQTGVTDASGNAARFNHPWGVAVDSAGNVYVADSFNHTIRKIFPNRAVTTLAGRAERSGIGDGTTMARFNNPSGVAVDDLGNVYVADQNNSTIRKVTPAGLVSTMAGLAQNGGSMDGTGTVARFNRPFSVAVDAVSNLYVTDTFNHTVRKVTPGGSVTTLGGSVSQSGTDDGIGNVARFNFPYGVAVDSTGSLYVADFSRITKGTPPPLRFDTSTGSLTFSNGMFRTRLTGLVGSIVVVEASTNLQSWSSIRTNALSSDGLSVSVPLGTNKNQFIRARLAP